MVSSAECTNVTDIRQVERSHYDNTVAIASQAGNNELTNIIKHPMFEIWLNLLNNEQTNRVALKQPSETKKIGRITQVQSS